MFLQITDIISLLMKNNKQKIKSPAAKIGKISLALVAYLYSAAPASAQTTAWSKVCVGGPQKDVATIQGLECLIANIFSVVISLIGLTAFLMFIVGSVRWLISGGSPDKTKKARDTLLYAVIGIVVALSAFIVLNLVAGFTGIETIKHFVIPTSN